MAQHSMVMPAKGGPHPRQVSNSHQRMHQFSVCLHILLSTRPLAALLHAVPLFEGDPGTTGFPALAHCVSILGQAQVQHIMPSITIPVWCHWTLTQP